ncbi:conserved hypothetical protein [Ricinus communis]|uniref:Uncharacterized protein n=1 Tax=Ricinus communis TaxID=3988 RepID=B9RYY2_RICCO|nr:conserved hypothetical protein [Ricinus communis]
MRRGSERKTAENEKTNSPWERGIMKYVLQHPSQQRCVLLHQLCNYCYQYHLSLFLFIKFKSHLCSIRDFEDWISFYRIFPLLFYFSLVNSHFGFWLSLFSLAD